MRPAEGTREDYDLARWLIGKYRIIARSPTAKPEDKRHAKAKVRQLGRWCAVYEAGREHTTRTT